MKKLGLVGGLGPASTVAYYVGINEGYQRHVNRPSKSGENPPMVIDSLNLAQAYSLVEQKDWPGLTRLCVDSIQALHRAGAEVAAISANTAHIVFDAIQAQSPIPVIGIVDEACKAAQRHGCRRVIIFGTGFTMSSGMYEATCARYGITGIVPSKSDQQVIHDIIFPNLEAGIVLPDEKARMLDIARLMLAEHQADALILGCTELPMMIKPGDLDTLLLDTTAIHIQAILQAMLA